jgi:hypothetical protein
MLVAPFWATSQALAQSVGVHVSETAEEKVLRITVHPAAEPRPALKYQLMPEFLDRLPGNAAVHYGKVSAEQISFFGDRELQEKIAKWGRMPLEELPRDEVRKAVRSESIMGSLRRASRSAYCDWQLPLREGNFFAMLIPEVQQLRMFARLLTAKARLHIAEGQFDEAVETLQIGYALGRHAAEGETLVHALVGIAISGVMSRQVQDLMQQPDAPNLYWALTMLPRPLISLRKAVEAEMHAVHLSFLELRDPDDATRSPEYWRDSLHRFWRESAGLMGGRMAGRPEVLAALAIKGYPVAKRALIRQGLSAEAVEAMPVSQVVLLYTMQTYEELRDDIFKWFYVPYWEGREGADEAEQQLMRSQRELREIIPVGSMLLPAVGAAQSAVARTDREIAVLRTIEALRMYAAANEGKLPETLGDLTVPVPIDAVTGKPFEYQLRDGTAVIEGPPLPGILLHLEIKVAR